MLSNADIKYLIIAPIFSVFYIVIFVKRWQSILKTMDFKITYKEAFNIVMGVFPFASITPSTVSDGFRAYYLKDRIRTSKVIGSVLTERTLDFITLCLFFIIGITFENKFEFFGIAIIILIGISLVVCLAHVNINLPLKRIWNERLQNIFFSIKTITRNQEYFMIVIGYSILIWILSVLQIMIFFYSLGIKISFLAMMAGVPLAIIIGQIPVTLGGAGTRDAALIILFSEYARPEQLLGVGLFFSLFRVWLPSIVGIIFMRKMINFNSLINKLG